MCIFQNGRKTEIGDAKVDRRFQTKFDIILINNICREMVSLALALLLKSKCNCFDCRKEVKTNSYMKCKYCKKVLHNQCITKRFKKDQNAVFRLEKSKNNFQCNVCLQFNDPIFIPDNS